MRYTALVEHWRTADLAAVPAADLLNGVCEIADEAAEYYITIQSGILPAAYMTEALFTRRVQPAVQTGQRSYRIGVCAGV